MQPEIKNINGTDYLIVAIPIQQPELSTTGKTRIVAKTGSPVKTNAVAHGLPVTFTMSAWIPLR
jgi:hypothetical protein